MERLNNHESYHFCSLGIMAVIILVIVITLCWLAVKATSNDDICKNNTNFSVN